MDEPKLPRRERERARHRQEILDAARRLVAAQGLEGVTVEQVAREAEFAVGSIYRHFKSKEDLIEALVVDLMSPMIDELEDLPASGLPFEGQLEACVRVAIRHFVEDLPFLQVLLSPTGIPTFGSEARAALRGQWQRYHGAVVAILDGGHATGALRPGEMLPMSLALMGMIGSFTRYEWWGNPPPTADGAAFVARAFLEGFRAR